MTDTSGEVAATAAPPQAGPTGSGRLAAHGLIYVLGTALQGLGVLAVTPFITRTLGRSDYGTVALGLVVIQLVGTVAAAGLPQVILREHHRGDSQGRGARALAGAMLCLAVGLGMLGSAAVAVAATVVAIPLGTALLLVWGSCALTGVVAGQALLRAQRRPWGFLVLAVASTVLAQLAGLLSARVHPSAGAFLASYVATLGLAAALGLVLGRPLPPFRERAAVRSGLRLSLPLLPHGIAMLVLLMGDVVLTTRILGSATTGSYQIALTLGNMPFVLATALFNAWAPAVFEHPVERRWSWTASSGLLLTGTVAVGAVGISLLSPWLVAVLAPATFGHAGIVHAVALISAVAPVYMLYQGSSLALLDHELTGRLAACAIVAAVTLLVVGSALAEFWGMGGVAVARLTAYIVLSVLSGWFAARRVGLRWPAGPLTVMFIGMGVLGVAAGALLPMAGAGSWVRAVLAAVLALATLVMLPRLFRTLRHG